MSPSSARFAGRARQTVLTVGAVLGFVCIVVTIAALAFGLRPLVFRSGSMSPTIDTGALAISQERPAADLRRGDIVSVQTPAGSRVAHRIHTIEHLRGEAILQLKGDANNDVDATPYRVSDADVVVFHVPWLGYAVGWLSSPIGLVLLGIYAAFLISVLFRGWTNGRPRPRRRASRSQGTQGVVAVALGVATLASGLSLQHRTQFTWAAWADASSVSGTRLTAYAVAAPPVGSCAGWTALGNGVWALTWPADAGPDLAYDVSVSGLSSWFPVVDTTGGYQGLSFIYGTTSSGNQNKLVTVTAKAYPIGSHGWLGPARTWKFRTGGSYDAPTCGETAAPAVTIQAPDGATRTVAAERAYLAGPSGCTTSNIMLCGTMSDDSTITNVDYVLQRTVGSTVRCWTGTWTTSCSTYQAATIHNQTLYYESASLTSVYASAGSYQLTVRVTDTWGNVTTRSVSFTLT